LPGLSIDTTSISALGIIAADVKVLNQPSVAAKDTSQEKALSINLSYGKGMMQDFEKNGTSILSVKTNPFFVSAQCTDIPKENSKLSE
jgi:hypothetical protein